MSKRIRAYYGHTVILIFILGRGVLHYNLRSGTQVVGLIVKLCARAIQSSFYRSNEALVRTA